MRLFPIEKFEIETPLGPEEVKQRLEALIEAPKSKRTAIELKNSRQFEGIIIENTFEMKPIDPNPRSYQPTFKGEIGEVQGKTLVVVDIEGQSATLTIVWAMLFGFGLILGITARTGVAGAIMPFGAGFLATMISLGVIYRGLNQGVKKGKEEMERLLLVELF